MGINLRLALTFVSRLTVTFILVAITAFCCFGFLASFEPPGFLGFRWLYGVVAVACVVTVVAVWLVPTTRHQA
jgi:hypothetical protein